MSLFKLETGQSLPAGKNEGFCITESSQGTSARKSPAQFPHFSQRQKASSQKLMIGVRGWRNLSPLGVAAWVAWVAYLPQPSERNPLRYLSAYQNFIKINAFRAIFYDDPVHKFESPELITLENDEFVSSVRADESQVILVIDFVRNNADLCLTFQFSMPVSQGIIYPSVNQVICLNCFNESGTYDITSLFVSKYGMLPVTGDNVIMSWQTFGRNNGQYFFKQSLPIVVVPVNPPFYPVKFGRLYNFYCFLDVRGLLAADWDFITLTEIDQMRLDLDPGSTVSVNNAGRHMKSTDSAYWRAGNDADNSSGLSCKGSGNRSNLGVFGQFQTNNDFWSKTYSGTSSRVCSTSLLATMTRGLSPFKFGRTVRAVYRGSGVPESYVGNDGKLYPVVQIGSLYITAQPLVETKFRNGDLIPVVTDNTDWSNLLSAGCCSIDNDPAND